MNTNTSSTSKIPKDGLKKSEVSNLMKNYTFPSTPFTVKQVYSEVGARHWMIRSFIKKNATVVGEDQKVAGANGKARGKAAKLYLLPVSIKSMS